MAELEKQACGSFTVSPDSSRFCSAAGHNRIVPASISVFALGEGGVGGVAVYVTLAGVCLNFERNQDASLSFQSFTLFYELTLFLYRFTAKSLRMGHTGPKQYRLLPPH